METAMNHFEMIRKIMGMPIDENLSQSSKEGRIAKGTNVNLGPVKKMMGNKTALSSYLKFIAPIKTEQE